MREVTETVTKYIAEDGSEWTTENDAHQQDYEYERFCGVVAPMFRDEAPSIQTTIVTTLWRNRQRLKKIMTEGNRFY